MKHELCTNKQKIPFVDNIAATESTALNLRKQNKGTVDEPLYQKVSKILSKNFNFKLKCNLYDHKDRL